MGRKKETGFTLIELLVTIALMLTLLGIAIVSYINVSNNKKKEAWEEVKKQIEVAALEYFNSNEYFFEGLAPGASGQITLGKLVDEDYINRVVDPRDGEALDRCNYVKVTKKDNGYDTLYVDEVLDAETCSNNDNMIVISEPGGPKISAATECEKSSENNPWCISDAKVKLKIETDNNGPIENIDSSDSGTLCDLNKEDEIFYCNKEGTSNLSVIVTNKAGKSAKWTGDIKIDKTAPKIEGVSLRSAEGNYNSNKVFGSFKIEDTTSGIHTVESNIPNKNGETDWFLNGDNRWEIKDYTGYAADTLDGSKITLKITAYDVAGNKSVAQDDEEYTIYKQCSKTKETTSYSNWSACSKSCGGGTQSRTKTVVEKDYYKNDIECRSASSKESRECNTQPCLSLTKISGVDSTYCSLRNPWGYSTKKYNESITGNNCRDTNSNPRIKFSNISGSISGTKATIKVTLDIYSTNWEMLATSSNNNNARNICIVSSNKFSSGKCISNSVEIKSKSGKWNSNQHVLSGKTVTLTVNNVDDYNNLAFRVYSPGKGVNANPTCTHSSGYNCKTSTGSPFIFQSDYFFKVNK